ncbi:MAG: hypothetical protein AB1830_13220 [Pseudomonadota bacterium]
MYKFVTGFFGVMRLSDGAFIPDAPGNRDWQEFREWLAKGNTPLPPDQPSLDEVRKSALAAIDAAAGRARARYITIAPGQEGTYLLKAADADRYKAAGYPDAQIASYPWILAKAKAMTPNPGAADYQAAADLIIATRDAWVAKGAAIEEVRERGKAAFAAATDTAGIEAARDAAVAELDAL